jgi:hypothetical protein
MDLGTLAGLVGTGIVGVGSLIGIGRLVQRQADLAHQNDVVEVKLEKVLTDIDDLCTRVTVVETDQTHGVKTLDEVRHDVRAILESLREGRKR